MVNVPLGQTLGGKIKLSLFFCPVGTTHAISRRCLLTLGKMIKRYRGSKLFNLFNRKERKVNSHAKATKVEKAIHFFYFQLSDFFGQAAPMELK